MNTFWKCQIRPNNNSCILQPRTLLIGLKHLTVTSAVFFIKIVYKLEYINFLNFLPMENKILGPGIMDWNVPGKRSIPEVYTV